MDLKAFQELEEGIWEDENGHWDTRDTQIWIILVYETVCL